MNSTYAFLFCLALGIVARVLYILTSKLAKHTDVLPVTVVLDMLTVLVVSGGFVAYVILSGATLAPYMFAALFAGYYLAYRFTKRVAERKRKARPTA